MLADVKIRDFEKYLEQEVADYQELSRIDDFFARKWVDYYTILAKFREVFASELADDSIE